MPVYEVIYELWYPEADNDINTAYVLASSFDEAQRKVEVNNKQEHQSANVIQIKKTNSNIYV